MKRVLPWLVALAAVAAAVYFGVRASLAPRVSATISAAPVVTAMRRVAQLATVEIEISDVVRYEEVKSWLVFDFPKSATLRLRGRVLGGFDLQSPVFSVVPDAGRHGVRVRLPRPRILAVDPRFEWFDERSGWLNPITVADRNRWLVWARGTLGRAAKDAGLEARAAAHARELLSGAAEAFGWTAEVDVEGVPAAPSAPAPSRERLPPPGRHALRVRLPLLRGPEAEVAAPRLARRPRHDELEDLSRRRRDPHDLEAEQVPPRGEAPPGLDLRDPRRRELRDVAEDRLEDDAVVGQAQDARVAPPAPRDALRPRQEPEGRVSVEPPFREPVLRARDEAPRREDRERGEKGGARDRDREYRGQCRNFLRFRM
jgi:hypothetical protein